MPAYTPLLPFVFPLLGALLILALPPSVAPRHKSLLAILTACAAFITSFLLLPQRGASPHLLSPWLSTVIWPGNLALRLDDLALAFLLLLAFLGMTAIFTTLDHVKWWPIGSHILLFPTLLILASGMAFILSADVLTAYIAWGFLDLSLFLAISRQGILTNYGHTTSPGHAEGLRKPSSGILPQSRLNEADFCPHFRGPRRETVPLRPFDEAQGRLRSGRALLRTSSGQAWASCDNSRRLTPRASQGFAETWVKHWLGGEGEEATRLLALSQVIGLALPAALLFSVLGAKGGQLVLTSWPPTALYLLLIAGLFRAGFYPLHLWLPELRPRASLLATFILLLPITTGLYLLARLSPLPVDSLRMLNWLIPLAEAGMLITALLAWRASNLPGIVPYLAMNQSARAVLVAGLGLPTLAVLVYAVNSILSLGLLALTQTDELHARPLGPGTALPRLIAIASLTGLPLTLGFLPRWFLHRAATLNHQILPVVIGILADAIILGRLLVVSGIVNIEWGSVRDLFKLNTEGGTTSVRSRMEDFGSQLVHAMRRGGPGEATRLAGLYLLALPLLLFGLHFLWLRVFVGTLIRDLRWLSPWEVTRSADPIFWMGLFVSLLGGYTAYRLRHHLAEDQPLLTKAWAVLDLTWLYRFLWRALMFVGQALAFTVQAVEGRHYLGWVALLGLLAAVLILGR
ncbi:MAG: proton-conducting transporter membrane subunit [Anaerolineae bacterium]